MQSCFLPRAARPSLVPKGDALYTGATVKVKDSTITRKQKKKVEEATENLPQPKPNSRFFGIPFKLIFYNMAGDTSKAWIHQEIFKKDRPATCFVKQV